MLTKAKEFFATLSPGAKQKTVIGVSLGALLGAIAIMVVMSDSSSSGTHRMAPAKKRDKINYDVLTGTDTKSLNSDALASKVKSLEEEVKQLRTAKPDSKSKTAASADGQGADMPDFASKDVQGAGAEKFLPKSGDPVDTSKPDVNSKDAELIERIKRQQEQKRQTTLSAGIKPTTAKASKVAATPAFSDDELRVEPDQKPSAAPAVLSGPSSSAPVASRILIFDEQSQTRRSPTGTGTPGAPGSTGGQASDQADAVLTSGRVPAKGIEKKDKASVSLPIGSILSGTIITGMDAPTSAQSRRDPFPALLRIKHDAILPNRFRMDVKECFIVAAGYGDMASERAYLRAEAISCVTNDGEVLESGLDAYAVGEDGKTGVRGRMVSKTGAIIGRSLLTGFLGGITNTLKPATVPALNLSPGGTAQVQRPSAGQVLDESVIGGVSGAANEVAKYYIEMAKNIFPVIEVDAGRSVDFIVTRSARLAPGNKRGNAQGNGGPDTARGAPGGASALGATVENAVNQVGNTASKFFNANGSR